MSSQLSWGSDGGWCCNNDRFAQLIADSSLTEPLISGIIFVYSQNLMIMRRDGGAKVSDTQIKHAYLIIAHTNFAQLQTLIDLLDDERNDLYLHIDKKAKNVPTFTTKFSGLHVIESTNVVWGGHSQIRCEMKLLEAAAKGHYRYYHLISGMDLPLKSQDEIHAFFRDNDGKEFLDFDENACRTGSFHFRVQYYYYFGNLGFNTRKKIGHGLRLLDKISVEVQKMLHICRKPLFPLYKGGQWFSITDEMVQYVLSRKDDIKKQFDYTFLTDEVFMPSVAMSSPLRDNVVKTSMRAIDWERGLPYTFRKEDVHMLLASRNLWGRKFDQRVDGDAVEMIAAHFKASAD